MNNKNSIELNFIDRTSVLYSKAIHLRYNVFFEPLGINKNIIYDQLEEKSLHLVAISMGHVLGYARLTIEDNIAQVSQMVVDTSFIKKGIGNRLLNTLVDAAYQKEVDLIYLNARLTAVDFYKKYGFKCIGDIFPSKKTELPHIRMEIKRN